MMMYLFININNMLYVCVRARAHARVCVSIYMYV